jgi:hypothetical protein
VFGSTLACGIWQHVIGFQQSVRDPRQDESGNRQRVHGFVKLVSGLRHVEKFDLSIM